MNTFLRRFDFIVAAIFCLAGWNAAFAATNLPPRLTIELRDGSRIVGTSLNENLKFHSALLGDLKLEIKDLCSIVCTKTNAAELTTAGGDVLNGRIDVPVLKLKTSFGKTELPVTLIQNVQISLAGLVSQPRSGLVALWSGEGNGNDAIGGNNGTLMDGVGFATGKVGQAFHFTGAADSFVKVADSPALRLTDALTVTFWVKKLQTSGRPCGEHIINKGGDWTHGELDYEVAIAADSFGDGLEFLFAGGDRSAGQITDSNWHHCAIVAVNGERDPTIYLDGIAQPITLREGSATINLYPSTQPLYVGAQVDPAYPYYSKTLVDELAIYNRALSASEIQTMCREQNGGKLPPPSSSPMFNHAFRAGLSGH